LLSTTSIAKAHFDWPLDKPKANSWAFRPLVGLIRLISKFSSESKRKARWTDELNSDEVLLGGNTLILKAKKL
jgi:hypothetical protein